jgi:hypothetical protein
VRADCVVSSTSHLLLRAWSATARDIHLAWLETTWLHSLLPTTVFSPLYNIALIAYRSRFSAVYFNYSVTSCALGATTLRTEQLIGSSCQVSCPSRGMGMLRGRLRKLGLPYLMTTGQVVLQSVGMAVVLMWEAGVGQTGRAAWRVDQLGVIPQWSVPRVGVRRTPPRAMRTPREGLPTAIVRLKSEPLALKDETTRSNGEKAPLNRWKSPRPARILASEGAPRGRMTFRPRTAPLNPRQIVAGNRRRRSVLLSPLPYTIKPAQCAFSRHYSPIAWSAGVALRLHT